LDGYDADLISYGQTGAGKTFTMFGPPFSMERAAARVDAQGSGAGISGVGILQPEHGCILRSGFEALEAVAAMAERGNRAALHGSMVEMSIMSLANQSVIDLLNNRQTCYVDKAHHLQGARMVPIKTAADLVNLAAAVEIRLVRGTRMNDTSSRSHCVTVFTLSVLEGDNIRQSRLQFFDLMGSERFKGANAAHDESKSTKSSSGGWEGIYANLSLSSLMSAVDLAAEARRKNGGKKQGKLPQAGQRDAQLLLDRTTSGQPQRKRSHPNDNLPVDAPAQRRRDLPVPQVRCWHGRAPQRPSETAIKGVSRRAGQRKEGIGRQQRNCRQGGKWQVPGAACGSGHAVGAGGQLAQVALEPGEALRDRVKLRNFLSKM
jgi:hypothetical protein